MRFYFQLAGLLIVSILKAGSSFDTVSNGAMNADTLLFRANEFFGSAKKQDITTAVSANNISIYAWADQRDGILQVYAQLYDAQGTPIGTNFRVQESENYYTQAYYPSVAAMGDRFLVVWINTVGEYHLSGQLIADDGSFIGSNFSILDDMGRYGYYPSVASNDSLFLVAWSDRRNGSTYDVYAQLIDEDGYKHGDNFKVHSTTQNDAKYYPTCAISPDGVMGFTWYAYNQSFGGYGIGFSCMTNDTLIIDFPDSNFVDNPDVKNAYRPDITYTDSSFILTWYQYNNGYFIAGQVVDRAGHKKGNNFLIDDSYSGSQYYPSVAPLSDTTYTITWWQATSDNHLIYARNFQSDSAIADAFLITPEDESTTHTISGLHTRSNSQGHVSTAWITLPTSSTYNYEVWSMAYLDSGNVLRDKTLVNDDVNSGNLEYPDIAVDDNGHISMVWQAPHPYSPTVITRTYSDQGNALIESKTLPAGGRAYTPYVAAGPDGTFMTIWKQSSGAWEIYGALLNTQGDTLKGPFLISTNEKNSYINEMNIVSDRKNHFLVVWTQSYEKYRILGQLLDTEGNLTGNNFLISPDTTIHHYTPGATIDTSGAFAVTWLGISSPNHIYMRRFDKSAQPIDSVYQVSDDDKEYPYYAALSSNDSGRAVIVFRAYESGKTSLYFQRFQNLFSDDFYFDGPNRLLWYSNNQQGNHPSASMNNKGITAIAWEAFSSSDNQIYSAVLMPDDTTGTNIFRLLNKPDMSQTNPSVEIRGNKIYYAFQSNHELSHGFNIYGLILNLEDPTTSLGDGKSVAASIRLQANYPNPFNPLTRIAYTLNKRDRISLKVYDIRGRLVRTLYEGWQESGNHYADFNAAGLASGLYFYTLKTSSGYHKTRKMMLLK